MTEKRKPKPKKEDQLPPEALKLIEEMAKNYKPRDPARIDKILAAIGELWKMQPDTRLGQLLMNFCFRYRENVVHISSEILAIYEQEDDVSLANLLKKLESEKVEKAATSKHS
ncbi:MAG: hypothetical protein M1490_04690 [Candidatus Bathyarchaeota archaeon]|nr:hypothetical protein [Candidatus Bathyarchaeota archaeon]